MGSTTSEGYWADGRSICTWIAAHQGFCSVKLAGADALIRSVCGDNGRPHRVPRCPVVSTLTRKPNARVVFSNLVTGDRCAEIREQSHAADFLRLCPHEAMVCFSAAVSVWSRLVIIICSCIVSHCKRDGVGERSEKTITEGRLIRSELGYRALRYILCIKQESFFVT